MRMSEKPTTPWIICHKDGKVVAGHCDCMAGLGESCSHIASLLWAVEAGVKKRESLTVTDKKAYWVMPAAVKAIPYSTVRNIKFFKSLAQPKESKHVPPSPDELSNFYKALKNCPSKPAILSLIPPPYSNDFVPTSLQPNLPPPLSELLDKKLTTVGFNELLDAVEELSNNFIISEDQMEAVERETRGQSSSRLWFRMRCGRITASKFKSVCNTDPANPSLSHGNLPP